jgi:hypothetical protein
MSRRSTADPREDCQAIGQKAVESITATQNIISPGEPQVAQQQRRATSSKSYKPSFPQCHSSQLLRSGDM